ncbi:unnamed protein product, partial [Heterobilharzia americana]
MLKLISYAFQVNFLQVELWTEILSFLCGKIGYSYWVRILVETPSFARMQVRPADESQIGIGVLDSTTNHEVKSCYIINILKV